MIHGQVFLKRFSRVLSKIVDDPYKTLSEFLDLHGLATQTKSQYLPDKLPSLEGLRFGLNILETWDFRKELKQFTKPAYFMFGRLDPIVPVKTMRFMQREYPEFKYMLLIEQHTCLFISYGFICKRN